MNNTPIQQIPIADPTIDRAAFLAARNEYFNASATAVLFLKHPHLSAADYWIEKVNNTIVEETQPMIRGQMLESAIAEWFAKDQGKKIYLSDSLYIRGHIAATPDYWMGTDLVEIKSTTLKDLEDPLEYWVYQVQTQMMCTDADKAWIVWLDGRMELHSAEIDRDPDLIATIWKASKDFMDGVNTQTMPDWIETEARHMISLYPTPDEHPLEVGTQGIDLVTEYWQLKLAAKQLDAEASLMRDALFNLAQDHDSLSSEGKIVATLRPRKLAARFDAKRFADENPSMYADYMGEPTTTRALNIPKKIKDIIEGNTP